MPIPPSDAARQIMDGRWGPLEEEARPLLHGPLPPDAVPGMLDAWSHLSAIHHDAASRLFVATTLDTQDAEAEGRYRRFREEAHPELERLEHQLTERFLASGVVPPGMELPARRMRVTAELFRPESQALDGELAALTLRYNRLTGSRTVEWEGQETTPTRLRSVLHCPDRARREAAWRIQAERQREDADEVFELWREGLDLKQRIARAAGHPGYLSYRWAELHRFDYSPGDCQRLHRAIEEVVVPAAGRLYAQRRAALGVDRLRPWDVDVDAQGADPLVPFDGEAAMVEGLGALFTHLDPALGDAFAALVDAGQLDLESRRGKAPVGYCIRFPESGMPFIFANLVGAHRDVQTLSHEAGHAFHAFEAHGLRWLFQRAVGAEFNEVASMAMELLVADLFDDPEVGFYTPAQATQARRAYLENRLMLWPRVACIDAFQHWAYTHPEDAARREACDAAWAALSARFSPEVDWSGLAPYEALGWQTVPHIHNAPLYYVEYGLALLGAAQIWAGAQGDRPGAVRRYRHALSLGGTASLPDLYAAAGARFAFDAEALRGATAFFMDRIDALSGA